MLLENKNAVIYGAGGSVGGAIARAFAREGARVFLTGRNLDAINILAKEISAAGGTAETAQVDALDEDAVASHLDNVVDKAETLDISFNAIGIPQHSMQGIPFTELSVESFIESPSAGNPGIHAREESRSLCVGVQRPLLSVSAVTVRACRGFGCCPPVSRSRLCWRIAGMRATCGTSQSSSSCIGNRGARRPATSSRPRS